MNFDDITIIIPASPIPSHPDTEIIEKVIASVRKHFKNNEIILQIDGLREERLNWKEKYDEYKNRILWKCLHEWNNVLPIIFDKHSHQSNMMNETIDLIKTPLIFYVESDFMLRDNVDFEWESIFEMFNSNKANTIRLYNNHFVPEEHDYLMFEKEGKFIQTSQWSQNPHISRLDYYREEVLPHVPPLYYIEDTLYGKVLTDCEQGHWDKHKLWVYIASEENTACTMHLDGRANTRKFTSDDVAWGLTE